MIKKSHQVLDYVVYLIVGVIVLLEVGVILDNYWLINKPAHIEPMFPKDQYALTRFILFAYVVFYLVMNRDSKPHRPSVILVLIGIFVAEISIFTQLVYANEWWSDKDLFVWLFAWLFDIPVSFHSLIVYVPILLLTTRICLHGNLLTYRPEPIFVYFSLMLDTIVVILMGISMLDSINQFIWAVQTYGNQIPFYYWCMNTHFFFIKILLILSTFVLTIAPVLKFYFSNFRTAIISYSLMTIFLLYTGVQCFYYLYVWGDYLSIDEFASRALRPHIIDSAIFFFILLGIGVRSLQQKRTEELAVWG